MKIRKSILLDPKGSDGGDSKNDNDKGGDAGGVSEEVKKQLEKVRLEERAKLREQLAEQERKASEAAAQVTQLTEQVAQLTTSLEAVKTAQKDDGGIDVTKLVAEVSEKVGKQYEEKLGSQVSQLTAQLTQLKLSELKSKLVREAGGEAKLVMALVKGNTEEELRASVKLASDAYKEIEARLSKSRKVGDEENDENSGDTETDETEEEDSASSGKSGDDDEESLATGSAKGGASGGGGAGRTKGAHLLDHVREMSPEDFKKNRENVHKMLRKRFGGQQNMVMRG